MHPSTQVTSTPVHAASTFEPKDTAATPRVPSVRRNLAFLAWAAITVAFAGPLLALLRFASKSELYSHVVLIPAVSGYIIWKRRHSLASSERPSALLGTLLGGATIALIMLLLGVAGPIDSLALEDQLALQISTYVLALCTVAAWAFGRETLRTLAFPLAFLFAMVPLPRVAEQVIESFLQHGSVEAAHLFFSAAGTTVFRDGTYFYLPGFSLEIAPQCSGIHSSLVLFLTSILCGYVFLKKQKHRLIFVAAVIPLALLRNGLRVFVLGELTLHFDADVLRGPLHHSGGPLFFGLSLIPLAALLYFLAKKEARNGNPGTRRSGELQPSPCLPRS